MTSTPVSTARRRWAGSISRKWKCWMCRIMCCPTSTLKPTGRDVRINEGGHFAPGGYVFNNGGSFVERYHGMEDIPPEHRIFAYPKLNIREQMAAYQEVIDRSALNVEKQRLPASREDR